MNITLSADKGIVERAREVARRQGKSLNELVRAYLEALAGHQERDDWSLELFALMDRGGGNSGGRRVLREELHDRAVLSRH